MVIQAGNGATNRPVGPNTDGMPTVAYFRKAKPTGDSYVDSQENP